MARVLNLYSSVTLLVMLGMSLTHAWAATKPPSDESALTKAKDIYERAEQLHAGGDDGAALPLVEEACLLLEGELGASSQDLAGCLGFQGLLQLRRRQHESAKPLLERALSIRENALGPEHPDITEILSILASTHKEQGKYRTARSLYERALRIDEKALGPTHATVAADLNNLATVLQVLAEYEEADALLERAVSITEATLGSQHPTMAIALANLGWSYCTQGKYEKANSLLERAISIAVDSLGSEHPVVAIGVNNLAGVHRAQGRYDSARSLYMRVLAIQEENFGPEHPHVATTLNNLGLLHQERGEYEEATPLLERALSIQEGVLGVDHPDVVTTLINLGLLSKVRGDFERASILYQRALSILDRTLGPEHPDVALCIANLAALLIEQGLYRKAEPLLMRALSILESTLGLEHPSVGGILVNIGGLYRQQGRYGKAEPLCKRGQLILERALGPSHPYVTASLHDLAVLYRLQGEYGRARPLLERALAIEEETLGNAHPSVASLLDALGTLYIELGLLDEAEPLLQRARFIWEAALGREHHGLATILSNLGWLYMKRREYAAAGALLKQSLEIRRRVLGSAHPKVAGNLVDLGLLSLRDRDYRRAEQFYRQALTIFDNGLGSDHPHVATSLHHLGNLMADRGECEPAVGYLTRALRVEDGSLSRTLVMADERRRLDYASKLFVSTHQAVTLHLRSENSCASAAGLALVTLLRRKGRVQDLVMHSYATLRRSLPESQRHLLNDLSDLQSRYAALIQYSPTKEMNEAHRSRLDTVEREQDAVWAELARLSPRIRTMSEPITIARVQSALSGNAALIEYTVYRSGFSGGRSREVDEERYAAYILFPDHFAWVDLGPAATIDAQIYAFRDAITRRADAIPHARGLYASIMKPVIDRLGLATHVFIAPDGNLNLVPFDALIDEYGNYLVERFHLHYLTSGRDLLRPWMLESPADGSVVVVANPSGADLPSTEREAALLTSLFPDTVTMLQTDASETQLRNHVRPRILHLATHGTFGVGRSGHTLYDTTPDDDSFRVGNSALDGLPLTQLDNPMLYSWLDLTAPAGSREDSITTADPLDLDDTTLLDDGRLTAYEVSGWDLRGTELVTLSACDTAQGTYQQSEGILGLRRAFAIAGAQTQVMSLWKVSDTATAKLMDGYYRRLLAGEGRSEAMRNTQLELLRDPATRHPRDWAAFVVVGEWGPLSSVTPPKSDPPRIDSRPRGCQATIGTPSEQLGFVAPALVLLPFLTFTCRRRRPARPRRSHPPT